ncbi:hypothetical protein [Streptomyces sioyaensis]|uniref:hypothetical protein n=1 Tax=Streptomyces sioyaensis TaxID=67364 RepID=UPI003D73F4A2
METDADTEKAQQVLDWIHRTKVTSFKAHELVTARRRAFPTVSSTAPALRLLEEHGYLRSFQPARNGTRGKSPAITSRVHPHVESLGVGSQAQYSSEKSLPELVLLR